MNCLVQNISVVIPFLEGSKGTSSVKAAIKSSLSQSISPQVILVSNYPNIELELLCNQMGAEYHCTHTKGVNRARNFGAGKAKNELVYFLDDDCVLNHQDHLEKLILLFAKHQQISALGGPYDSPNGIGWKGRGYNAMANAWLEIGSENFIEEIYLVNHLLGGNMCFRKSALRDGFDNSILSGGDEAEFFYRKRPRALLVGFSAQLAIGHHADSSWRGLIGRAKNQGRARVQLRFESIHSIKKIKAGIRMVRSDICALPFSLIHFSVLILQRFKTPHNSPPA